MEKYETSATEDSSHAARLENLMSGQECTAIQRHDGSAEEGGIKSYKIDFAKEGR